MLTYKIQENFTLKKLCLALGETERYEKALGDIVNGHRQVPSTKVIKWAERTGIHPHFLRPDIYRADHFTKPFPATKVPNE
ncbi:hypothetical protein ABK905_09245 [Acerihabitans sp. KWT182]|uniref:XRE family transcriptional regulator n=1 Tax=Acerihabitans sp. KWT182 TaxID=3157919 RepID=A0AAU7QDK4_9GAMM